MGRSSQFCRGSDSHFWSDVAHDHWATNECNRALCKVCQGTVSSKSFLLNMCIEAPESITNVSLLALSKRVPALPKLRQESRTYLLTLF